MKFNFEATGVGSVPFTDPKTACRVICENFKSIPFWPQLPKRSFLENMYVQYAEGLPGLSIDEEKKTIHIDTSKVAAEIENVYSKYLDGDVEFFRISEARAKGLYEFPEALKGCKDIKHIKGHITGPLSYGLFLTDQNKRPVIYDKDLFEILTKTLVMKARWQIRRLKKIHPSVIIFIDEPYLVSIGSSFVNISAENAADKLDELVDAIKKEGAICGIHCCGNTDWSILLKRDIDILNFDAYNFMKEFSLYHADIKNFTSRGGTIAWGMVPTSEAIDTETRKSLIERYEEAVKMLSDKGVDRNLISSLVTPSCGVGAMDETRAAKVIEMTVALSAKLIKNG
ncbi:MAG: methionine synthase [Candidatus Omnitrophica bacterium]|nr:methionine synthase [Candidatus Omnitrophota bacterium]